MPYRLVLYASLAVLLLVAQPALAEPGPAFTVSTTSSVRGAATGSVTLDGSSSTGDIVFEVWTMRLVDAATGLVDERTGYGDPITFGGLAPGLGTVTLDVYDSTGFHAQSPAVVFGIGDDALLPVPVVTPTPADDGVANGSVVLDGTGSLGAVAWVWEVAFAPGDGGGPLAFTRVGAQADVTGLPAGVGTARLTVLDAEGHAVDSEPIPFEVAKIVLEARLTAWTEPSVAGDATGALHLDAADTTGHPIAWIWQVDFAPTGGDPTGTTLYGKTADLAGLAPGAGSVTLTVYDTTGASSVSAPRSFEIGSDGLQAEAVFAAFPSRRGGSTGKLAFTGAASRGAELYQWTITFEAADGSSWTDVRLEESGEITDLPVGTGTIQLTVYDALGHVDVGPVQSYVVEGEPLVAMVSATTLPTVRGFATGSVTLDGTASTGGPVLYEWTVALTPPGEGPIVTTALGATVTIGELPAGTGSATLALVAGDGSVWTSDPVDFVVGDDALVPVVDLVVTATRLGGATGRLEYSGARSVGATALQWDIHFAAAAGDTVELTSVGPSGALDGLGVGQGWVTLTTYDDAGHSVASAPVTFVVDGATLVPVASLYAYPAFPGSADGALRLDGTASRGEPSAWIWSVTLRPSAGGVIEQTAVGAVVALMDLPPGSGEVTLTVAGGDGSTASTPPIAFAIGEDAGRGPFPRFTVATTPSRLDADTGTVALDGTSSLGGVIAYAWRIDVASPGDGTLVSRTASGPTAVVTGLPVGQGQATLTVYGADGTSVTSAPVAFAIGLGGNSPALAIATTVSTGGCPGAEVVNVRPGASVVWCFAVTNSGDMTVTDIQVDEAQQGAVGAPIAALAPGETATVAVPVAASSDLTLNAWASGTAAEDVVVSPQDGAVVHVVNAGLGLDLTLDTGAGCPGVDSAAVPVGAIVGTCYRVRNTGNDTLASVTVTDGDGGGVGIVGALAPGQSASFVGSQRAVLGDVILTATATALDGLGDTLADTDAAPIDALFALLGLQKTVSADGNCPGAESVTVLAGATVTTCYTVTNTGETFLGAVTIEDDDGSVVALPDLAPGQSATVSLARVARDDEATDATARALDASDAAPVSSAPDGARVDVVHPALTLVKSVSVDGHCPGSAAATVLPGTAVVYCYAVTNSGDTTVRDIVVGDEAWSTAIGALAEGQSATVARDLVAPATEITTAATASGTDDATWTPVSSAPSEALLDVIHPTLSVAATVSTTGACPGSTVANLLPGASVTWCFTATNTGDVALAGVTIASDAYGVVGVSDVLAPGQSMTATRSATLNDDVALVATARGYDALLGRLVAQSSSPAVANVVHPAIDVDVTIGSDGRCPGVDAAVVVAGTTVVGCYRVSNLGDEDLVAATLTDDAGRVLERLGPLAAGQEIIVTGAAFVLLGDVTLAANVEGVSYEGFVAVDSDTAVAHATFADLALDLTAPSELLVPVSGRRIDYSVLVTNHGTAAAEAPVVIDTLPSTLALVAASTPTGTCALAGSDVRCTLARLAPGASATVTITLRSRIETGTLTNTIRVETATPETTLANNAASASTTILGATRKADFFAVYPDAVRACLAANGDIIDVGLLVLRNETYDNEIDSLRGPDRDRRIETAIAMAMGILDADPRRTLDRTRRSDLEAAKLSASRELLAATCNRSWVGTPITFDLAAAVRAVKGSDSAAILAVIEQASAYNASGANLDLPVDPGARNAKYPWDDPTDPND